MIAFRSSLASLILAAALAAGAAGLPVATTDAAAAELVMLERPGCAWCARWNREIAPIYPLTEEGRRAPLRRVDVTRPWPEDLEGIEGDLYTPTFIVVENGAEVARLRGYPGDNFFWPLLGEMLNLLPPAADVPRPDSS
ncbi:transcriptional regulator [Pelagibius sp. CAU 1746]|uniref:transcriptional regulator n=1 Tax=Pelagibius sp. CAU 1746 TaxID=3140370 RepID=UPI00325C0CFF